ncbi:hypothetical protein IFM89_030390 [Coptis chinensis]|uniref:Uncharacterized protein n=1 Tax=Coptis chinensis TaxID=261450 RepID=A0A835M174_9MAGN|nr:hypothetical protein IFM89_030390 [Coptis chinensis]
MAMMMMMIRRALISNPRIPLSRFSSGGTSQSFDIDLSNEETKRKKLSTGCCIGADSGYLELDLVLGNWVEEHVSSMDESGIKALVHVLDLVSIILFLLFNLLYQGTCINGSYIGPPSCTICTAYMGTL